MRLNLYCVVLIFMFPSYIARYVVIIKKQINVPTGIRQPVTVISECKGQYYNLDTANVHRTQVCLCDVYVIQWGESSSCTVTKLTGLLSLHTPVPTLVDRCVLLIDFQQTGTRNRINEKTAGCGILSRLHIEKMVSYQHEN